MAYFDTKSGSLEEAIRQAVGGKINEAKVVMDLENDDPKLMKDIKGFGLKVKDLGDSGNKGYNEYEISGPQSKIDAASKKLNLQASYHEKLDPVNKKALKKDFDDRKDKDIDNDGDVDSSDKYLAKRRKAVSKAISKEETDLDVVEDTMAKVREFKIQDMKAALADIWGMEEGKNPFKKEEEEKPVITKGGKTLTGKKPAEIDVKPKINKEA